MDGITEKDIYEALGLGEQAQEPAEPAQDPAPENMDTGVKEQEPAEPVEAPPKGAGPEPDPQQDTPPEGPTGFGTDGDEPEKKPQTPEQRRENAARRRQQEMQKAVDTAVQKAREEDQKRMEGFFQRAGLKNTVTGKPIASIEEFDSWMAQHDTGRAQQELEKGKLTRDGLDAAIGAHPMMQKLEKLLQREEAARKQQQEQQAQKKIQEEIGKIRKIDESVSSLEDLFDAPYGQELYEMVEKGYSLSHAHYLLNHERLENAKLEAAKQQAALAARGKAHMTGTANPRGGGSVAVPREDMAMFRLFMPEASDAEIQAYYNKQMKK